MSEERIGEVEGRELEKWMGVFSGKGFEGFCPLLPIVFEFQFNNITLAAEGK
ncbi:unnamed protein product [Dovyalis caffra]|uniref:Uncharacterized protein n=1 Tax=Dovyalis caffra TaxID=77055 RepID=A0AAV1R9U5_9ROSI|nr:unnamed protein product [Dovyalis caffra]